MAGSIFAQHLSLSLLFFLFRVCSQSAVCKLSSIPGLWVKKMFHHCNDEGSSDARYTVTVVD